MTVRNGGGDRRRYRGMKYFTTEDGGFSWGHHNAPTSMRDRVGSLKFEKGSEAEALRRADRLHQFHSSSKQFKLRPRGASLQVLDERQEYSAGKRSTRNLSDFVVNAKRIRKKIRRQKGQSDGLSAKEKIRSQNLVHPGGAVESCFLCQSTKSSFFQGTSNDTNSPKEDFVFGTESKGDCVIIRDSKPYLQTVHKPGLEINDLWRRINGGLNTNQDVGCSIVKENKTYQDVPCGEEDLSELRFEPLLHDCPSKKEICKSIDLEPSSSKDEIKEGDLRYQKGPLWRTGQAGRSLDSKQTYAKEVDGPLEPEERHWKTDPWKCNPLTHLGQSREEEDGSSFPGEDDHYPKEPLGRMAKAERSLCPNEVEGLEAVECFFKGVLDCLGADFLTDTDASSDRQTRFRKTIHSLFLSTSS